MGRRRGSQRDGFTASGAGKPIDRLYGSQDVPAFVAKHQSPPYLRASIRRKQKGMDGED